MAAIFNVPTEGRRVTGKNVMSLGKRLHENIYQHCSFTVTPNAEYVPSMSPGFEVEHRIFIHISHRPEDSPEQIHSRTLGEQLGVSIAVAAQPSYVSK